MSDHSVSAFGVIHKAAYDSPREQPETKAPVRRMPGKFDTSAIRAKLAPLKDAAVKAAVKR